MSEAWYPQINPYGGSGYAQPAQGGQGNGQTTQSPIAAGINSFMASYNQQQKKPQPSQAQQSVSGWQGGTTVSPTPSPMPQQPQQPQPQAASIPSPQQYFSPGGSALAAGTINDPNIGGGGGLNLQPNPPPDNAFGVGG
jgi:hypothetical protein